MKLNNSKIREYMIAYNNTVNDKFEIPFATLYKVRKNMGKLEESYKPANQTMQDIVDKYAIKDDDGNIKSYSDEHEFVKEAKELDAVENEIDIEQIPMDDFGDAKVTPAFMNAIFFMIKD